MIKVGDRVRSYDFPHNDEIYIEGEVIAIKEWEHCEFNCGLPHVHIRVDLDTWPDYQRNLVGCMVYPVHPESGAIGFHYEGKASKIEVIT